MRVAEKMLVLVTVALVITCGVGNAKSKGKETMKKISVEEEGIIYTVPNGWEAKKDDKHEYKVVYGPKLDGFVQNIIVSDVEDEYSADKIIGKNAKVAEVLGMMFLDVELLENKEIVYNDTLKGVMSRLTYRMKDRYSRQSQYIIYDGKKCYKFVCSSLNVEGKNESNDKLFDDIIRSVKFK
ncbi:MAG: hypothetical protein A2293_00900 [Elusimicrobia bacterium RIFOXYB2_FULL_49_7]|nr:MAG: hypothetical protein A2293_00900 [Elusimicrobia bacterium RIFOXYB2_FULL_49_7]